MNKIELLNIDCMEYMATLPDKHFELAVVDPPYGIGEDGGKSASRCNKTKVRPSNDIKKNWDKEPPSKEYFNELIRVSKNQIIWGANHFISRIPFDSPCWIVWDKNNGKNDFADAELAYTSFPTAVRLLKYTWAGMIQQDMKNKEKRIHPTQKLVKLYKWIFDNYNQGGGKILDTHLGSGSSAIAAHIMGYEFVGCEIDKDYYESTLKRFSEQTMQQNLFTL